MNGIINDQLERETPLIGTVVAVQANFYKVKLEDVWDRENLPQFLLCTRRSLLKKIGQQVMVGDRVIIAEPDWSGGRGAIEQVFPRRTVLDRPPIANADQILLVFAIVEPDLDITALTRFLIKAESTGLEVSLCLNKCDLIDHDTLNFWLDRLSNWGYKPLFISVMETEKNAHILHSMTDIYQKLQGKITVVSGPSGVGKSSLINRLIPQVNIKTGLVSGKLGKGRHTTRHVELFELPLGGLLADSPGFNQHNLDCEPEDLANYFPEARERIITGKCQFTDCLHSEEPNCIVRGEWERYSLYVNFLGESMERSQALQKQPDAEAIFKSKFKQGGKANYEPKLESKKYRRSSRRSEHQKLDQFDEYDETMEE